MEFEEALDIAVSGCDVKLYGTKIGKRDQATIYTIFIHDKQGISLDKCSEVSRAISPVFDIYEPISSKYFLEVSSPGIERVLKTLSHFKLSVGEYIKIKTKELEKHQGILELVEDDIIELKFKDHIISIAFDDILKAQTYVKW